MIYYAKVIHSVINTLIFSENNILLAIINRRISFLLFSVAVNLIPFSEVTSIMKIIILTKLRKLDY